MKRRLNYTERKKIVRKQFSIILIRQNGSVVSFYLDRLDIDDMGLPGDARIYVEGYYRTERKHFDFGTVARRVHPPSCNLTDMAYPENLKFRILIVNPADNKILAQADRITPEETQKKPILPVEFKDLGNRIWCIEYEGDEGAPILCINSKIPNIQNIAKQDPQFLIYVYPAVVREILTHMVFIDKITSPIDPAVEWHANWLKFSRILNVQPLENLNHTENSNFDKDEALKWIEEVVETFSNKYTGKFQEYVRRLEGTS